MPPDEVAGVILAGGLARRMGGGDKALLDAGGRPLLAHVVRRLAPQCKRLLLSANGDPARFAAFGLDVAEDTVPGHAGPLAGVLTGLEWTAAHLPGVRWVTSAAADTPLLPPDLVERLLDAAKSGDMAVAASGGRTHPVFGLWPVSVAADLRAALEAGERKIDRFTARYRVAQATWPDTPADPFFNVNTPQDLERLEGLLAGSSWD